MATHNYIPEISACLIAKIDKTEINTPIFNSAVAIIATMGLGVAIIAIIINFFLNKIVGPLESLKKGAEELQNGNLEAVIKIDSNDEIGEVSKAFNSMAVKLNELYKNLELKVTDRTLELNSKLLQIEDQNKKLDQNKSAMLNLLEDSKTLEEELKAEKQSVEKKIIERTREVDEEKTKLMAAIEALTKAFVMMDLNGEIILVNENLNKIFNLEKQNWLISDIQEQLGDSFDFVKAYKNNILEKKKMVYDDIALGSKILQIRFSPVFDKDKVNGVLAIIGDVTDEKVLARSKDEFFSIASHELRTPLTAIRGNTSMMLDYYKESFKDPELNQMLLDTHEASVRLIGIVNDFLDMSRLELSKIEFKMEKIILGDLIGEVLKEYKVTGLQNKLYLKFVESKTEIPAVNADVNRVKQVVINLIGNSVKFTKEGGISISLTYNNDFVEVHVADTGYGIPLANQSLLFRKFQQAGDSTLTRDGAKGTGLGLYISKLMVEGMGGKIFLEKSEENKGSTFTFSLPVFKK